MSRPNPSWMQPPSLGSGPRCGPQVNPDQPHLLWPWKLPIKDSICFELEAVLYRKRGKGCQVVQYLFDEESYDWVFTKATTTLEDLKDMVLWHEPTFNHAPKPTTFFMASSLQDEAIRLLGTWMKIPPRFFMLPDVRLGVIAGPGQLFFTLQFMNKYAFGHENSRAQRPAYVQHYRFRTRDGHCPYEWRTSQARLIMFTDRAMINITSSQHGESGSSRVTRQWTEPHWRGLYMFDEADGSMALQLKDLMTANDRPDPDHCESFKGAGQIVDNIIYLINSGWSKFFDDAELHLQVLSEQCLGEELPSVKQFRYMQELHGLSPLWTSVRRQLTAIKDLIAQVLQHEISDTESSHRTEMYYVKRLQVVDDHINRCNDAAAQTNNLISLIFNIATLQESRAAVEESKAANAFTGSIRRVTMLTFIYLPLTLASSILGMNIVQITGEGTHSQLWLYFVVAAALMAATFGGWFIWSQLLSGLEHKLLRLASLHNAKEKDV